MPPRTTDGPARSGYGEPPDSVPHLLMYRPRRESTQRLRALARFRYLAISVRAAPPDSCIVGRDLSTVEVEQDGCRALLRTAPRACVDPVCRALGLPCHPSPRIYRQPRQPSKPVEAVEPKTGRGRSCIDMPLYFCGHAEVGSQAACDRHRRARSSAGPDKSPRLASTCSMLDEPTTCGPSSMAGQS